MGNAEHQDLSLGHHGPVLKVTLNRPGVLNALSRCLSEELDHALAIAAKDEDVRVMIIAGAGRASSAGPGHRQLSRPLPDARR